MMKYHVHVYMIVKKAEIDLDSESEEAAMKEALTLTKKGELEFGESDCKFLALPFKVKDTETQNA